MPPRRRAPKAAREAGQGRSKAAEKAVDAPKPKGRVFTYRQRIWRPAGDPALPGESNAAVLAALNAGERPNGDPVVDHITDCGRSVIVTWAVPVEGA